jgi:hypothetical protein
VQLLPDPPMSEDYEAHGAIAQLGERLVCNQKVTGSIPVGSTIFEHPNNLQSRVFGVTQAVRLLFNNPKVFLF